MNVIDIRENLEFSRKLKELETIRLEIEKGLMDAADSSEKKGPIGFINYLINRLGDVNAVLVYDYDGLFHIVIKLSETYEFIRIRDGLKEIIVCSQVTDESGLVYSLALYFGVVANNIMFNGIHTAT